MAAWISLNQLSAAFCDWSRHSLCSCSRSSSCSCHCASALASSSCDAWQEIMLVLSARPALRELLTIRYMELKSR